MFKIFNTMKYKEINSTKIYILILFLYKYIQGESLARGPKLLSIYNYVIDIMT